VRTAPEALNFEELLRKKMIKALKVEQKC